MNALCVNVTKDEKDRKFGEKSGSVKGLKKLIWHS